MIGSKTLSVILWFGIWGFFLVVEQSPGARSTFCRFNARKRFFISPLSNPRSPGHPLLLTKDLWKGMRLQNSNFVKAGRVLLKYWNLQGILWISFKTIGTKNVLSLFILLSKRINTCKIRVWVLHPLNKGKDLLSCELSGHPSMENWKVHWSQFMLSVSWCCINICEQELFWAIFFNIFKLALLFSLANMYCGTI